VEERALVMFVTTFGLGEVSTSRVEERTLVRALGASKEILTLFCRMVIPALTRFQRTVWEIFASQLFGQRRDLV
jgi:hypothetical protein